jgi:superoxide dismutase, Cu-Zn family
MNRTILFVVLAMGLPAIVSAAAPARTASAAVARPDGVVVARATLTQGSAGILVAVSATGLAAGRYGIHLHETGLCEGPAFASAGAHWNPAGRQHGRLNPMGFHGGDLPNLDIAANGAGRIRFTVAGGRLRHGAHPLLDAGGASIVIHAAPDDERTDPSGNSGARIACGVVR